MAKPALAGNSEGRILKLPINSVNATPSGSSRYGTGESTKNPLSMSRTNPLFSSNPLQAGSGTYLSPSKLKSHTRQATKETQAMPPPPPKAAAEATSSKSASQSRTQKGPHALHKSNSTKTALANLAAITAKIPREGPQSYEISPYRDGDSSDEDDGPRKAVPRWARSDVLYHTLKAQVGLQMV